ncbi:diaminopimelate decarboxylase [Candidatus Bathyarchaeota archaeon]|nr:diaminopimelate decarboxylase [Candidatus Bathyarchaeota archaeon]
MLKSPLENVGGKLYIDSVSAVKLAETFGTPLYVISENKIRENYKKLREAFSKRYPKFRILYSAKANTNISVLKILHSEGAYVDTVSAGEVYLALSAGFHPNEILYTGVNVGDKELKYVLNEKVMINLDSLSQLNRLLKLGVPEILSFRINPEYGAGHHEYVVTASKIAKFGIDGDSALKAYEIAKKAGVKRFGIHMHIGSGIMDVTPYLKSGERLLEIASKINAKIGISFDFIDLGGGIGVPYKPEDKEVNLDAFCSKLVEMFKSKLDEYALGQPELWIEPGRFIVAEAGILLTTVTTVKHTPYRKFVGVDAGFNTLIRPAMYGAYHHILVANRLDDQPTEVYDVVGPICESGDVLARDRLLPKICEGDLLAVLNAGAYGFSMSSQYNSRPRPAEVLVKGGKYTLIREAETFDDLTRRQRVAEWLEG